MAAAGIVTEYNPFHNGHLYHLRRSRQISSSRRIIAVMNGNFTQRGEPACLDKWLRAEMAVKAGVDLVLELPVYSGVRSAHYFAQGAVRTLAATGVVDKIVFGSESGEVDPLLQIADILAREPRDFRDIFHEYLRSGKSYARARTRALTEYISRHGDKSFDLSPQGTSLQSPGDIISSPNNILGVEYIKNIIRDNLDIEPAAIKRRQASYHEKTAGPGKIASATAIRKLLYEKGIEETAAYLPEHSLKVLKKAAAENKAPLETAKFENMALFNLRRSIRTELKNCPALSENIVNTILSRQQKGDDYQTLIDKTTSRNQPSSRIRRGVLQALLRFDEMIEAGLDEEFKPEYLRVLALGGEGEELLSELDKKADLPVITNPSQLIEEVNFSRENPEELHMSLDILASDIYSLLYPGQEQRKTSLDFFTPLIKHSS